MKCPRCGYVWKLASAIKGGLASKRRLTPDQARAMQARSVEARRRNREAASRPDPSA